MTEGKPYLPWPGADDRIVVEELLRDPNSGQWYECHEFVKKLVQARAKNIPRDYWDDVVQDAMIRIEKFLPTFKYQCTLRTSLFGIVRSSIIDAYRKFKRVGQFIALPGDPHDDVEQPGDVSTVHRPATVEDECIIHDELDKAMIALHEYLSTHANSLRNGRILDMVMFEGRSLEEAAKAVGCSAPVAGYIVRSAQRYAREKLGHQP
jgi:RNA polymerase sigma factor (sigma-70 family)